MWFPGVDPLSGLVYQDGAFSYDPVAFEPAGSFERIGDGFGGNAGGSPDVDPAILWLGGNPGGSSRDFPAASGDYFLPWELSDKPVSRRSSAAALLSGWE
jgi:hypothetical protein